MADVKISALPLASTPLAGTEVLPIVQSATTDQVSVANLTAGRAVSAASLTLTTTPLAVGSGGTGLTSLTAGYIPYASSSSALSFSSPLYTDGTSVGVGTGSTTIGSKLEIQGASASNCLRIRSTPASVEPTAYYDIGRDSDGYLKFNGAQTTFVGYKFFLTGAQAMTLDASGNLGVGETSPSTYGQLVVKGGTTSATSPILALVNNSFLGSDGPALDFSRAGFTQPIQARIRTEDDGTASSNLTFWTKNTGTAGTLTKRMTLDASGNLGIGTTSPSTYGKFVVYDTQNAGVYGVSTNLGGYSFLQIQNTGTGGRTWQLITGGSSSAYGGNLGIYDVTAGQVRLTVDSSGNLLVGTTGSDAKLNVYGNPNSIPLGIFRSSTSGDAASSALNIIKYANDSTTGQVFIKFVINNNAAGSGQINANGANTAAFGTFSDARLKENIVDLPSQLDNILALRPREFDYIESEGGGHQIGFVAQEMQTIYPDAVGEREDGMLTVTAWSKTEARLVSAIQELAAKVSALEAKVA